MKEEKQSFMNWIKSNKRELIIAGISIAALITMIVGLKNKETLMEVWSSLQKKLNCTPASGVSMSSDVITFPVNQNLHAQCSVNEHIRNLPSGWNASSEKLASAVEHGYILKSGQTWVDAYTKGNVVA